MGEAVNYYPLTHPQKGIWYTEKMYPNTSIGNIAATLRLKGDIDYSILEKAINIFIQKNDGMRLKVVEIDGEPKQYVSDYEPKQFDFYDFGSSSIEELYKWDSEQSQIPFDIIDKDLYYFALVKINENDGGFFVKTHHLISDAWTMSLMGNQIVEFYTAIKNGKEISKENKPSYLEYIKSEEEYKKSDRFIKDKDYWNEKIGGISERTTLKTHNPNCISSKARRKTMIIPKKLSAKLREYCAENKTSIYSLLLVALSMYINRVVGKQDIILGTTILNRLNAKEKDTVGVFMNSAPVKIGINDDMDFKAFAEELSRDVISLLRHQKYPLDLLIKEIRSKTKSAGNLFDIFLNYQNSKFNKSEHDIEYITRWHFRGYQAETLIIHVNDREDEGQLIIDYDYLTDLFHANEIEFIHQHIINLLWHALDNPTKKISQLNMLSEKEKHKILFDFYKSKIECLQNQVACSGLKEQIEKIPNNIRYYILDRNLNLLPISISGELYISSDNLTSEFLSELGLDKEEIIDNPFEQNKKMFRTGYIARWFPNGGIEYLGKKEYSESIQKEETKVRISATFTSEPIADYIKWWGDKFGYNLNVEFAGYNQVFQEFLDPNSMLSKNKDGINVVLIRFEDFLRDYKGTEESKLSKLDQEFKEIQETINKFDNTAPLITAIFPVSTHIKLSSAVQNKIKELNVKFEEYLSQNRNIYTVNFNGLQELYNISEVFDSLTDKEGHMPFTEEYYAATGTEIARKICAIKKQHFKVIVLDCDDTLWEGICGEQGPLGVKVEGVYRELQEFMLQKYNEGMLLAICSKNNEKDVWEVFDKNPRMILGKKNIVSYKINWEEKSQNIKEMAKELNLGLDSFIFIDDSTLECSKMVEACPEVLTLQIPSDKEYIPMFLQHVWAFDRVKVTKEDILRTSMYEAEQKRKKAQDTNISIDDFIENLELKVSMREIIDEEVERASQMTQRTNQFNLSTIRRTEQEIRKLMQEDKIKCFIIEASDKFGDYGVVGLVILKEDVDKLFVDTFLLSCRVLGRRVEDIVLSGIRRYANEQGKKKVEAFFVPTEKNKPILDFVVDTKWNITEENKKGTLYNISINNLPGKVDYIDFYYKNTYDKNCEEVEPLKEKEIYALDHVAIAVKSIKEAEDYYKTLGYSVTNFVHDLLQNSYLSMCNSDKYLPIELVAPVNEKSPSYNTVEMLGEHPYHLCYRVSSIKNFLEKIKDIEYELISDEKPAILFNNQKVVFIMIKKVGLIELVETEIQISNNNKFKNNIIKLVVSDLNKALTFYEILGYEHVKNTKDIKNDLIITELMGCFGEKIELITPLNKESEEYKFLKHTGTGVYKIHFGLSKMDKSEFSKELEKPIYKYRNYNVFYQSQVDIITSDDCDLCDTTVLQNLKHKEYLLPIENYTGKRLLQLPIFETVSYEMSRYEAPTNEIEEKLTKIWAQILRIELVGIDDDFFELGGDSLHVIQLQVNLLKHNWNLSTQDIYRYRTIRELSKAIANKDKNDAKIISKSNEEAIAVKAAKGKITNISDKDMEYSNIFLIGATGYLGPHILDELLTKTKSNIYCLVRSKTNNDGKERLQDTLKFYFGDKYNLAANKRVFIISGDITSEHFGMGQNEYIQFQQKIDAVVHAGALVSHYGDYSKFEEINVKGTEKVIRFCQQGNKPLAYISTMSISGQYLVTNKNDDRVNIFTEDDLYIGQNYYNNPYVRSKYEAEILANKYINEGAKIIILRAGNLTGRFADGHFQRNIEHNEIYNILKSLFSIGAVSKNILNKHIDFTPVDYMSKAVVNLLMKSESVGRTFHLYNYNIIEMSQLIELFNAVGINIKCLEKNEFRQLIEKISSDKTKKDCLEGIINYLDEERQLGFNTSVKFDSEITVSYLKQLGFEWPLINVEYIQKIVDYMKYVKYLT